MVTVNICRPGSGAPPPPAGRGLRLLPNRVDCDTVQRARGPGVSGQGFLRLKDRPRLVSVVMRWPVRETPERYRAVLKFEEENDVKSRGFLKTVTQKKNRLNI